MTKISVAHASACLLVLATLLSASFANEVIQVDHTQVYQEFYGCGASWTDSSAWVMNGSRDNPSTDPRELSSTERQAIFDSLFSKTCDGCIGLDILRQPMGTSDFRWSDYTFEDTKGTFTINRDEPYIIPTIKTSIGINPNIKVMALPWSAPAWAKDNNSLNGGSLKTDTSTLNDYHQYFVNFVNAYEAESVPIWAISVQNEPQHSSNDYPTMTMSSSQHGNLIRGVRSALNAAGKSSIKVVGYDHNWDTPSYVTNFLSDSSVRADTSAVGFHCYAGDVSTQTNVRNQYPDVEIFFTECTEFGTLSNFNPDFRWALRNLVIGATRNWASTVIEWNMVLFFNGPKASGGCSNCRGLIDVDNSGYSKNPAFYALGHLSRFVKPGARRIDSTEPTSNSKTLAMLNTDGSSFVVILNDGNPDLTFDLQWFGATCTVFVKSWSAATVYRSSATSLSMEVYRTTDQESGTRLKFTETITCVGGPAVTPVPTAFPQASPTAMPVAGVTPAPTMFPEASPSIAPTDEPFQPNIVITVIITFVRIATYPIVFIIRIFRPGAAEVGAE